MKNTKLKKWDRVEIDWVDSIQNTGGWKSPDDFSWKTHYGAMHHKTIGYYINECKLGITVCQAHADDNDDLFVGAFTMPKGCILKIRKLK